MRESEFVKLYKKRLGLKNKEQTEEKIELFWDALFNTLDTYGKVTLKDWGVFTKKKVASRKVSVPTKEGYFYTEPKEVIKFREGKGLGKRINKTLSITNE